jgi:hypothetical protein
MAKKVTSLSKEDIINIFPNLKSDTDFTITSPATPLYNCIAWAYCKNDKWMWPKSNGVANLDGLQYWPEGIENSEDVSAFISAFMKKGYSICKSYEHEDGFQKIALYVQEGTTNCTHAALESVGTKKTCGKWKSKLGKENDIQHSTPYGLEGQDYGKVYCIMKRKFP